MNRRVWIVAAMTVTLATTVIVLSMQRLGSPAPARAAASGATLPSGANATDVYTKLTAEIEVQAEKASRATSPAEQIKVFESIAAKLEAFRNKYPNTPESLDAAFQLGSMNYGLQEFKQAEKYLLEFVKGADSSDHEKLAYAHYYLAETYKAEGKYDPAEAEYKIILRDYSDVNPKLTDFATTNLAGLAAERKLAVGGEPVAFDVKGIKGERLSPAAYRGKVLLIDFWATWCGPCVAEMPNVKSVYTKFHGKGFEIVGISLDQSRDKLDRYITNQGIEWPQYFDGKWWNNDVAVSYGIKSIPATFLVDRKGKIRYKSLRGKQLEAAVEELLAEKV